jgi:hypothetical protein
VFQTRLILFVHNNCCCFLVHSVAFLGFLGFVAVWNAFFVYFSAEANISTFAKGTIPPYNYALKIGHRNCPNVNIYFSALVFGQTCVHMTKYPIVLYYPPPLPSNSWLCLVFWNHPADCISISIFGIYQAVRQYQSKTMKELIEVKKEPMVQYGTMYIKKP